MGLTEGISLLLTLIDRAKSVSSKIAAAKAEGRDSLTSAEVDELAAEDTAARTELDAAIAKAKSEGR